MNVDECVELPPDAIVEVDWQGSVRTTTLFFRISRPMLKLWDTLPVFDTVLLTVRDWPATTVDIGEQVMFASTSCPSTVKLRSQLSRNPVPHDPDQTIARRV